MSPLDVLLVEDNPGDVHLIEAAFGEQGVPARLRTVNRGDEALDCLFQRGEFVDAPRPQLVLLDLNLPIVDGIGVLEAIKADPELKRLPVIVLTGSDSQSVLDEAYDAHANACLVKPTTPAEVSSVIQAIVVFWMTAAALPTSADENSHLRQ